MSRAIVPISIESAGAFLPSPHSRPDAYEEDCLRGRRFPRPGDAEMWRRCRESYRIREWVELFKRHHISRWRQPHVPLSCFRLYFPPILPLKPVDVTRPIILQWFRAMGQRSGTQANTCLSLLRTMFTVFEEWGFWSGDNPCKNFRWFPRRTRDRFVSEEEMPRLIHALDQEPPFIRTFYYLLLFTGCRSIEGRDMQWSHLDLRQGLWTKPMTKNGRSHMVPLPPVLITMLDALPRKTKWVFASPQKRACAMAKTRWFNHWERIRTKAGLPDVRIHDLRRTMATWLVCNGANLSTVQAALNHTSLQNTSIYARFNTKPLRAALTQQADAILRCAATADAARTAASQPSWPVTAHNEPMTYN